MNTYIFSIKKVAVLFTALLFSYVLVAQEPIILGHKMSIYSTILGEDRSYWISLPTDYYDTIYTQKEYPVCYFFDGKANFENLVAQRNRLASGPYASIPNLIMVGILHKDRTKDLTPTASETPSRWGKSTFDTSGGNEIFMQFVEQELKPLITKTYRTQPYEILIGHSFGALAVVNTYIHHPNYYNAYVAIEPSMWWDNEKLLNSIDEHWQVAVHPNKTVILAKANDAGSGKEHHSAILALAQKMEHLSKGSTPNYSYLYYPKEDHGSVVVPAEYDALRIIFDGYQLPVKKVMKSPNLMDEHFKKISEKLSYTILPSEQLVDKLAQVCVRRDLHKQAKELLHKNMLYYPESAHAKKSYKAFIEKDLNTEK